MAFFGSSDVLAMKIGVKAAPAEDHLFSQWLFVVEKSDGLFSCSPFCTGWFKRTPVPIFVWYAGL